MRWAMKVSGPQIVASTPAGVIGTALFRTQLPITLKRDDCQPPGPSVRVLFSTNGLYGGHCVGSLFVPMYGCTNRY